MKINEITGQEKSFLTLKGIKYNFSDDLAIILHASNIIGKSLYRRSLLKDDIDFTLSLIKLLLNEEFNNNDPDIISVIDIYNQLEIIKNQL